MDLRNRFVRSATYDAFADEEGYVTDKQIRALSDVSMGGVGFIITGITYVHPNGKILPFQNSIAGDKFISELNKLTNAVHRYGAKIALQLFHGGRAAANFLASRNRLAFAPSFIEADPYFSGKYRALRRDEIWEIVNAFGDGAKRAREAGFDAIQIHGAHAYLLSQFLSPYTNRRGDEWGGNLENRVRIHREIYQNVRYNVGDDFPVLIKVGVQDGFPGGLDFSEGKVAATYLAEIGFDALEISQGLRGPSDEDTEFRTKINNRDREAYYRSCCAEIKEKVDVPIMMVGGLRTFELMEEIVQQKEADFISLSRPLIREPGIINDWKRGNLHRAECISCNRCLKGVREGITLRCIQREGEKTY